MWHISTKFCLAAAGTQCTRVLLVAEQRGEDAHARRHVHVATLPILTPLQKHQRKSTQSLSATSRAANTAFDAMFSGCTSRVFCVLAALMVYTYRPADADRQVTDTAQPTPFSMPAVMAACMPAAIHNKSSNAGRQPHPRYCTAEQVACLHGRWPLACGPPRHRLLRCRRPLARVPVVAAAPVDGDAALRRRKNGWISDLAVLHGCGAACASRANSGGYAGQPP